MNGAFDGDRGGLPIIHARDARRFYDGIVDNRAFFPLLTTLQPSPAQNTSCSGSCAAKGRQRDLFPVQNVKCVLRAASRIYPCDTREAGVATLAMGSIHVCHLLRLCPRRYIVGRDLAAAVKRRDPPPSLAALTSACDNDDLRKDTTSRASTLPAVRGGAAWSLLPACCLVMPPTTTDQS